MNDIPHNPDWNTLLEDYFIGKKPRPPVVPARKPVPPSEDRLTAPATREELRTWCQRWLDVSLPAAAVCPHHATPLDYLDYVFFERGNVDPLVWACRGGGKTLLGAVATLLDMLFKPGVEVRILAGSDTQSQRMYEHLVRMVETNFRDRMLVGSKLGRIRKSGFHFGNGSRVELLAQTESSVRGARVQKVRCDEVDLFDPKVWDAVQLTTRSKSVGSTGYVRGTIEAFSTLNSTTGVMQRLLQDNKRKVFTWFIWDVIEKCTDDCNNCILQRDCRGLAHSANGFVPLSDVKTMRERVRDQVWRYEVLCDPKAGKCGAKPAVRRRY